MALFKRSTQAVKRTRDDIWAEAAAALGSALEFESGDMPRIACRREPWTVTLTIEVQMAGDTPTVVTVAQARFLAREDLRMTVTWRTIGSRIAEALGLGGIAISDPAFRRHWVVRSRSKGRVRSLLSDGKYRRLFPEQRGLRLTVGRLPWRERRRRGDRVRRVRVASGIAMEPQQLVECVELVHGTLERLVTLGAADREPVQEDTHYPGDLPSRV
ncbi:MAG: hypothetical protein D6701_07745 [Gemmatimonadetes bacterium]|nr:MAG: hypothetical protein D6701_07745 [Gemmatimonadota bacterium]